MPANSPRTLVIAEAGVNHNGSLDAALALVDAAAATGADVVKFQTFDHELLAASSAQAAPYQVKTTGLTSQAALLKSLELSRIEFETIATHCRSRAIEFLSTAFDRESLEFLIQLGIARIKIPSGDLTDGPALLFAARTGLPMIISTGMATLDEVRRALNVVAFGRQHAVGYPSGEKLEEAFTPTPVVSGSVSLLHCVTAYPTPVDEVNLRAADTLLETFGLEVGLSDHTLGHAIAVAAVARGATIIEKHITLDSTVPGPDQQSSLEPDEFRFMVESIRNIELALGDGEKRRSPTESTNLAAARRSLVAGSAMRRGELFTEANLAVRRPGTGVSPMRYWSLLGTPAARDYKPGDLIEQ